jgi:ribosomal-protein-alanine N-acetyltransferase
VSSQNTQKEDQAVTIRITERIHLSELLPSDQAACIQHMKDKGIYDLTLRIPYPYTEADFRARLEFVQKATKEQGQPVNWAIRDKEKFLIGGCGFSGLQIGKSHRAEIGYWLAKPYWGQGIMTAVVGRLCEFAFAELNLVKIEAQVFAGNAPSAKVLAKCGFVQEGYLRKHHLKDGKYLDAKLFALVKETSPAELSLTAHLL